MNRKLLNFVGKFCPLCWKLHKGAGSVLNSVCRIAEFRNVDMLALLGLCPLDII